MKLTKSVIDKAVFKGKGRAAEILWDSEVTGFGVRIYPPKGRDTQSGAGGPQNQKGKSPSGKKSFVVAYRFNGRSRQRTIGSYGHMTLDQARKEARKLLVMVASGVDPAVEKEKRKRGDTVKALCESYLERHSKVHNKEKTFREDERRVKTRIIPAFGSIPAQSLTRSDVAQFHNKLGKDHPYEANRVRSLISSIFERAREWGLLPDNHQNPTIGVKRFREHKRDRWVKHEELPNLARAISEEENIYVRSGLWLYLLTGMRKLELLAAKWADVDFEQRQLRLADTKAGRTHYVELSPAALEILENTPRTKGNPYIIVGRKRGQHMVNIDIPWRNVRKRAGIDDVRLHDLRRTFGSWLASRGTPIAHIGKLLNHSNSSTTEIYAHFSKDPLQNAVEDIGQQMIRAARKTSNAI